MRIAFRVLLCGLMSLSCSTGAFAAPKAAAAMDLRHTVQAHFDAVAARDMNALLPTLTDGDALTLIFPDGSKIDTRRQFVDFHRKWFADRRWHWHGEVVSVIERGDLAHVLARYRYDSVDDRGQPKHSASWLTLVFAREQGHWHLVFDQNTRLPEKTS
jgi:ketosteroid isomerase-like protein